MMLESLERSDELDDLDGKDEKQAYVEVFTLPHVIRAESERSPRTVLGLHSD